ncbi:MAG: signal recognition particle-docking protein FtsY [Armatimonadetes bacterium]|nr:signal recognition particle-docking protein FtsY [Armatimonadota bacterium]
MRFGLFKNLVNKVKQLFTGRSVLDDAFYEELETLLLQSDINIHTAERVLDELRKAVREERLETSEQVLDRLKRSLVAILTDPVIAERQALTVSANTPTLYLVVGVNGVGKTTSIAKMANMYAKRGKKVILAAGDTFRAAAIDQLEIWAERTQTELVKHKEGTDPAAVVFDAIRVGRSRGADYVIADTAGRLHNRSNLMDELKKIYRVTEKELGRAPDEVLMVLDATTGQNALSQAKHFMSAVHVTGIILTKLDGTAKGGIVVTLANELKLPIKLIGVGEKAQDIEIFDPVKFVDGLFESDGK